MKRTWGVLLSAQGTRLHLTPRRWVSLPGRAIPAASRRRAIRLAKGRPTTTSPYPVNKPHAVPLYGLPVMRGFVEPTWVDLDDDDDPPERFLIDVSRWGQEGIEEN